MIVDTAEFTAIRDELNGLGAVVDALAEQQRQFGDVAGKAHALEELFRMLRREPLVTAGRAAAAAGGAPAPNPGPRHARARRDRHGLRLAAVNGRRVS